MKTGISILTAIHGLIHFMGFAKAFGMYEFNEITQPISKPLGIFWLMAGCMLIATVFAWNLKWDLWWVLAWTGIILSQAMIICFWKDARFGTLFNAIILTASVAGFQAWELQKQYHADVQEGLQRNQNLGSDLLTLQDIEHLPVLVQDYLKYARVLNKPIPYNVKITFDAQMRGKGQDWFDMQTEQYNFFDASERFFFLEAKVKGLPAKGYHRYKENISSMNVKLFSAIPIVKKSGEEMFEAETVTLFNDMCFLVPASLIDKRIEWEEIDHESVKAHFTNQGVTISAILYFNEKGQLVNFISDNRWDINEMKQIRFSTPLSQYKEINGFMLPSYGEAIWHYPEGDFTYGRFQVKNVEYNVESL
ncbi:MAG: DUF6544 family protein [Bacteroidales bacterium]